MITDAGVKLRRYSIQSDDECIIWTGSINHNGYGHVGFMGRTYRVHRLAYEFYVGPIPEGYDLDHICEVRSCINVRHLQPISHAEHRRLTALRSRRRARVMAALARWKAIQHADAA